MIPKIVHYCWFGGKKKPKLARKCIKSWKKYLPDYTLKEWNESNFDINCNRYVREAYESRRFAFVTDYVRLYALYTEGGIYMDTDVEVLATLDEFLHHNAFSGFEDNDLVPTGIMASEKGSPWAKELFDQYANIQFIKEDGSFDIQPNTERITNTMLEKGLVLNNSYQDFPGLITLYPSDYFCPKSWKTGEIHLTERTRTIHHFAGSWKPENNLTHSQKIRRNLRNCFHIILSMVGQEEKYNAWRRVSK